jgi:exonuclease V gamma subunit
LFDLNSLQKYHINQVILKSIINHNGEEAKEELEAGGNFYLDMMAKGMLPAEPFASTIYKELFDESSTFADKLQKLTDGHDLCDPVKWELKLEDGVRLTGNLRSLYKINKEIKKQVLYFFAEESAKYKIEAWLNHLAINTCSPVNTVLLFKDKEVNFPAIGESKAVEIMNDLTAIFIDGCSTHPLPFFPKSAYAFVNETAKAAEKRKDALAKIVPAGSQLVPDKILITTEDEDSALKKAAKKYEVDPDWDLSFGDAFDKYIKYCFTEDFFFATEYTEQLEEFKTLAKSILCPMLESIKQGEKEKIAEEE